MSTSYMFLIYPNIFNPPPPPCITFIFVSITGWINEHGSSKTLLKMNWWSGMIEEKYIESKSVEKASCSNENGWYKVYHKVIEDNF